MGVFGIIVVSVAVVKSFVAGGGAFGGPASSANLTFDGAACLILKKVLSSELVIMRTYCNWFENLLKSETEKGNWIGAQKGAKSYLELFVSWARIVEIGV